MYIYKKYHMTMISDTNRFKGLRIHIYNNNNGTYGFVELGKNFNLRQLSEDDHYVFKCLWDECIDLIYKNNKLNEYEMYKFSDDFFQGFSKGLEYRYLGEEEN